MMTETSDMNLLVGVISRRKLGGEVLLSTYGAVIYLENIPPYLTRMK